MAEQETREERQRRIRERVEGRIPDTGSHESGALKLRQDLLRRRVEGEITAEEADRLLFEANVGRPLSEETPGIGLRTKLAFQSDTPDEFRAAADRSGFEVKAADGELFLVPHDGGPAMRLDPQGFDAGDIGDFFGGSGAAVAGGLAGSVTGAKVGGGAGGSPAGAAIGAIIGGTVGATGAQLARERTQEVLGTQTETAGEVTKRLAIEAGFDLAGGAVGEAFTFGTRAGRGRAMFDAEPRALEADEAARRQGIEIFPGELADSQFLASATQQQVRLRDDAARAIRARRERLVEMIDEARSPEEVSNITARMEDLMKEEEALFHQDIRDLMTISGVEPFKGGAAMQRLIAEERVAGQARVSELYRVAQSIEEPVFLYSELRERIQQEWLKIPEVAKRRADSELNQVFNEIVQRPALADKLRRIDDPILGTRFEGPPITPTEQLLEFERRLREIAINSTEPVPRAEQRAATRLANEIKRTLDDPLNQNPQFRSMWSRGRRAAARRFDSFDLAKEVGILMRDGRNAELLSRFQGAGVTADDLIALVRVTPGGHGLALARRAFMDDLIEKTRVDPDYALRTLNSMAPDARRIMLRHQGDFIRDVAKRLSRVPKQGLQQFNLDMQGMKAFGEQIGNPKFIQSIRDKIAREGATGPTQRWASAAVVENYWNRIAKIARDGQRQVQAKDVVETIEEFRSTGAWDILTDAQRGLLADQDMIVRFLGANAADSGAELVSAGVVGSVGGAVGKIATGDPKAGFTVLGRVIGRNRLMAYLTTNEIGRNFIRGFANPKTYSDSRKAGAILLNLANIWQDLARQERREAAPANAGL